jgi:hypothetical protein
MPDKPAEPDPDGERPSRDMEPKRDEAFRLACRRYSKLRARMPR